MPDATKCRKPILLTSHIQVELEIHASANNILLLYRYGAKKSTDDENNANKRKDLITHSERESVVIVSDTISSVTMHSGETYAE